jgi:hypothetical protein
MVHFQRIHEQDKHQRNQKNAPNENKEGDQLSEDGDRIVIAVSNCADGDYDKVKNVKIKHESRKCFFFLAKS